MNKKILFPILFSLCSLNSINATEKTNNVKVNNKGFDTKTLVVSNVATFTLGGLAGYLGNKKLSTDKVVEENSKLKTENTTLKNKHDYENEYNSKCIELQNLNHQIETLKAKLKTFTDIWGDDPTIADVKKGRGLFDWYKSNRLMQLREKNLESLDAKLAGSSLDKSHSVLLYPSSEAQKKEDIGGFAYAVSVGKTDLDEKKLAIVKTAFEGFHDFFKTLKSDLDNAGN